MKKAKKEQREQEIRNSLHINFKKYMDKKICEKVIELDEKRKVIEELREQKRAKSRSKSRSKSKSKRKGPTRSPIKLEHSLDIEESKLNDSNMPEIIEESLKSDRKKRRKTPKENKNKENKNKYSHKEVENFDYDRERGLIEDSMKILFKLYAEL